ncbi:MAG: hypothetical protein NTY94_09300 [Alphaproteobacteria bacterium]|nr:hypothetical protein [Alphaproteobacteria bacterium]
MPATSACARLYADRHGAACAGVQRGEQVEAGVGVLDVAAFDLDAEQLGFGGGGGRDQGRGGDGGGIEPVRHGAGRSGTKSEKWAVAAKKAATFKVHLTISAAPASRTYQKNARRGWFKTKRKNLLFLKKKNQKDFHELRPPLLGETGANG